MITYLTGDATDPQTPGNRIIVHVCNDTGGWGRGFVLSVSKRWPRPEQSYRRWYQDQGSDEVPLLQLGEVQFVRVEDDTFVANMVAQRGVLPKDDGTPPIRYGALEECLKQVATMAADFDHASVHMPRIGCGLAGGKWEEVEKVIQRALADVPVYVYDFDTGDARTVPWTK